MWVHGVFVLTIALERVGCWIVQKCQKCAERKYYTQIKYLCKRRVGSMETRMVADRDDGNDEWNGN